jgi:5-methylcytosine-specific restriction protein A
VAGYCDAHQRDRRRRAHASLTPLYQTRRWRRLSARFLADKVCAACEAQGVIVKAAETDHIEPHRGDTTLFWDETNWQPLCASCHSAKTWRETLAPATRTRGRA